MNKGLVKHKCNAIFQNNSHGIWTAIKIYQLVRFFLQCKRYKIEWIMLSLALISVTMKKQSGTFSCKTDTWVSNNSSTSTCHRTWRNNQYFSGTNKQTGSFNTKSVIYTSEPLQGHSEAKSTKHLAKSSSTPLVPNPSTLTTPPKRRIHFVNYLDDNDSQKQWKQTQRQRCRAQSTLTGPVTSVGQSEMSRSRWQHFCPQYPPSLFCKRNARWLRSGPWSRNALFHWARGISEILNRTFCWLESAQ